MEVKSTDFTLTIVNETRQKASAFLRLMMDKITDLAEPNTPKKEGNLRRDTLKQVLGLHGTLKWVKSYASVQERGKRADGTHQIRNYTTPGTGPKFAENAVNKAVEDTNIVARAAKLI